MYILLALFYTYLSRSSNHTPTNNVTRKRDVDLTRSIATELRPSPQTNNILYAVHTSQTVKSSQHSDRHILTYCQLATNLLQLQHFDPHKTNKNRYHQTCFLGLKCVCGRGSAPEPAVGAYSARAPPDPLAGYGEPLRGGGGTGREGQRKEERRKEETGGGRRREGGKDRERE